MIILNSVGDDNLSSRMDKYIDEKQGTSVSSRTRKNQRLYENINHDDLENVNLTSNAHVIGDNEKNINVDKIKEILEKKYQKAPPKRKSLYEEKETVPERNREEETKEYDINAIIEKAKLDKEVDYERDRLKKIRDTQYDILKGLDLEESKEEQNKNSKEQDLMNLINTITEKEQTQKMNPLDLFTDLKGSDNTEVYKGMNEEITKKELEKNVKDQVKKEIDKTFYTNSLSFTKSDFDDFNDLKEDIESNKTLIKILAIIIIIIVLVVILFLINFLFKLNWF